MPITGLEALVFGVEDMATSRQYLPDYGLTVVEFGANSGRFESLDDGTIVLRHASDPGLPARKHRSPCLRETGQIHATT